MYHLRNSNYRYLIPVILMIIPQIGLRAWRWKRLMAQQGIQCPLRYAFIFYFAAIYIGLITPGRLGEFAKCYFLKHNAIADISQTLPSVIVDRVFDMYFLAIIGLAALYYIDLLPLHPWIVFLLLAITIAMPWLLLRWAKGDRSWVSRMGRHLSRISPRWENFWFAFLEGTRSLMSSRLFEALLLTALSYAVFFAQTFLIGRAVGLPLDIATISMVVAIGVLVGYVPITIAGLGTREAVLIYLFGHFGISVASVLSFAFLYNLVYIACVGVVSVFFWIILPNRNAFVSVRRDIP